MNELSELVIILIVLAIAIPLGLLIGAVLLRAAVYLHNRFVGGPESPRGVGMPSMQKAVGIALVILLANSAIGAVVSVGADLLGVTNELAMSLPAYVLQFFAMALVLAYFLPTRYSRALGVTACHAAICLAIAGVTLGVGLAGAAAVDAFI